MTFWKGQLGQNLMSRQPSLWNVQGWHRSMGKRSVLTYSKNVGGWHGSITNYQKPFVTHKLAHYWDSRTATDLRNAIQAIQDCPPPLSWKFNLSQQRSKRSRDPSGASGTMEQFTGGPSANLDRWVSGGCVTILKICPMIMPSHGNNFLVTVPLWGETSGHWWITFTRGHWF